MHEFLPAPRDIIREAAAHRVIDLEPSDIENGAGAFRVGWPAAAARLTVEGEGRQVAPAQAADHILRAAADRLGRGRRRDAGFPAVLAAGREIAARRRLRQVRQPSLDGAQAAVALGDVEPRDAGKKAPGIRVRWRREDPGNRPFLEDLAGIHHCDAVAEPRHDAEVVGDIKDRRAVFLLQLRDEVEDVGLGRHVEPGRRLVHDQKLGVAGEGHGDQHPLLLPAGKLVRVAVGDAGGVRQVDAGEQVQDAVARLGAAELHMLAHDLADLVADPEGRVERGLRILIDHGDPRSLDAAQRPRIERQDVDVLEVDRPFRDATGGVEPAHRREGDGAFPRAAFAHDRQGLAGAYRQVHAAHRMDFLAAREIGDVQVTDRQNRLAQRRVGIRGYGRQWPAPVTHRRSSAPRAIRACRRRAG